MKKFIFDVDGTLTPSRKQMHAGFSAEFLIFCCKFDTYLVTGSDKDKTIEQVGSDIYNRCKRVFNCSGSDIYDGRNSVYRSDWRPSDELISFLNDELDYSSFPIRTGDHIEHRPGGINFSILGRGEGNMNGRDEYVKWDINTNERRDIASRLKDRFPELNVQIGGQTGLDISDGDKSQILRDFNPNDTLHFYGDKLKEGENDYPLAHAIEQENWGMVHEVNNYRDTWNLLR